MQNNSPRLLGGVSAAELAADDVFGRRLAYRTRGCRKCVRARQGRVGMSVSSGTCGHYAIRPHLLLQVMMHDTRIRVSCAAFEYRH
eukprot:9377099-Pyramimonas_sp.AAC.1